MLLQAGSRQCNQQGKSEPPTRNSVQEKHKTNYAKTNGKHMRKPMEKPILHKKRNKKNILNNREISLNAKKPAKLATLQDVNLAPYSRCSGARSPPHTPFPLCHHARPVHAPTSDTSPRNAEHPPTPAHNAYNCC